MSIWDQLTPEAGQRRRQWLNKQAEGLLEYVPPEMRPWLMIADELNPITSMERAGEASNRMVAPGMSGWDRMAAAGDMLSNVAGVVAPAIGAKAAGLPVANAVEEVLTGYSPMVQPFMWDEYGGIRAFHGSPHDFDRFDMSKIGTGEGAQAYGHGLYFADSEAVARGYRDNLSLPTGTTAKDTAARILDQHGGDYDAALSDIGSRFNRALSEGRMDSAEYDRWMKAQRMLLNRDPVLGRMYEVQISANPDDFIDYDQPWDMQPENVRRYFDYLTRGSRGYKPDGAELAGRMESNLWIKEAADAGIPGIRYLDAGSRGAGDGSRNYVVFDDQLISIIRKYGIAGAAAIYGVSAADIEAAMAQEQPRGLLNQ